jgi:hypothetical protein
LNPPNKNREINRQETPQYKSRFSLDPVSERDGFCAEESFFLEDLKNCKQYCTFVSKISWDNLKITKNETCFKHRRTTDALLFGVAQ